MNREVGKKAGRGPWYIRIIELEPPGSAEIDLRRLENIHILRDPHRQGDARSRLDPRDASIDLFIECIADLLEQFCRRIDICSVERRGKIIYRFPQLKGRIHGGNFEQTSRIEHLKLPLPGYGAGAIIV